MAIRGRCQICAHNDRLQIEVARLSGGTLDFVAEKFGVHRQNLWRHMQDHISPDRRAMLIADVPIAELAERARASAVSLLDYFEITRKVLIEQMLSAASVNDRFGTATLARQVVSTLEKIGRLSGEMLDMAPRSVTNNINIVSDPIFIDLQAMMVQRLATHPEALKAVVEGLRDLETRRPQPALEDASNVA